MKYEISSKELKRFDEFNKLIRLVYPESYMIIGDDTDVFCFTSQKEKSIVFKDSYFHKVCVGNVPVVLVNSILFPNDVNKAIKNKPNSIIIDNIGAECGNNIYLQRDGKDPELIGYKLYQDVINVEMNVIQERIKRRLDLTYGKDKDYSILAPTDQIEKLINFEVVTFRPVEDETVGLISTCKIFPNVKKMNSLKIDWFVDDDRDYFPILLTSTYTDANIVFSNLITGIRC